MNRKNINCFDHASAGDFVVGAGKVLVKVDHFAFTSNNVSYAVTGTQLKYWEFFPTTPPLHHSHGRIPVWGFATVVVSRCVGVSVGDRVYGYFPMSHYTVLSPSNVNVGSFVDGSDHRATLPATYNFYRLCNEWGIYKKTEEELLMLFMPLFATSFLIQDFLEGNGYYGATTVIISSASSKTSIGLACLLHQKKKVKVIGLTSNDNLEFVRCLGLYDSVVTYNSMPSSLPSASTACVYVDMSGNGSVLAQISTHFADNLKYSCAVGATHWDSGKRPPIVSSRKPVFFFCSGLDCFKSETNRSTKIV